MDGSDGPLGTVGWAGGVAFAHGSTAPGARGIPQASRPVGWDGGWVAFASGISSGSGAPI